MAEHIASRIVHKEFKHHNPYFGVEVENLADEVGQSLQALDDLRPSEELSMVSR